MISVRFLRDAAPYAKGGVAGFPARRADRLCAAGTAERVIPAAKADCETVSQSVVPPAGGSTKRPPRATR